MQEAGQQRFQVQDLAPVLEPLLAALFTAFNKPDSAENEYVMRCVMRVIGFVGPEVTPNQVVCLCFKIHFIMRLTAVTMYATCTMLPCSYI